MRLVSVLYEDYGPFLDIHAVESGIVSRDSTILRDGDIVLLHGGEDISPTLYNHPKHAYTGADKVSKRDAIEWAFIQRAKELNLPIIGICRG